jgi:1A family penicillin-binding protein
LNTKRVIGVAGVAIAGVAILVFSWIWFAPCALGGCAPLDDLAAYQAEGSELLDMEGQPFATLATVNRKIISLDSLPQHVPQAFLAIEDRRFYDHSGLDFRRTAGALIANVRSGEVSEGGSTITQQLARNLFPEWLPYQERSIRRKVMEARVARQIERNFRKDKILELYLNHIYLGSGAYGIEAAAHTYFGKPAAELTLMEAATLGGLPQAPSQINPRESLERSTRRRDLVLDQMVEAGYIRAEEAAAAKGEPITLVDGGISPEGPEGSYFVERVRLELEETVGSRFYTAGLKIHTTLDSRAQVAAEEELRQQLAAIESGGFGVYRHPAYTADGEESATTDYLQGAVVVMDAQTGAVRALIGGRDFSQSKFDRATQALRQAGSAFKPFVYTAALQRYGSPAQLVEDSPIRLTMSDGQVWEPQNYTGEYDGPMTLREALTRSKNTATVRVAQDVGIGSVIATARSLGITSDIPDYPSTALGAADVRPIELISAYAAFANGGERVEPYLVERVEDRNGRVLWEAQPGRERILDPAVAYVMTTVLQDVVSRGTGSAVRGVGFRGPAAGKTGTTNDATDAWFVGYTPELVAGVWIGLDDPKTIVRGASGGTLAAPVWGRMMQTIYEDRPMPEAWARPSGVVTAEVDRVTGDVVSEWCPPQGPTYTEYFINSAPPQRACSGRDARLRYTLDDSLWVDEEWGDLGIGAAERERGDLAGGIDWPELESLRRRIDEARRERARRLDEIRDGRGLGPAGSSRPGDFDPTTPGAADFPNSGRPGDFSPIGPRDRDQGGDLPPRPDVESGADDFEAASDDPPELLGVPTSEVRQR